MFGFGKNDKAQDPVCGMKVDKKTEFSSENDGAKYYFCSENCKDQFNANPKDYMKENATKTKSCC
ncbi:MAG: hypothetical protein A3B47_03155 [Candidatus Levybacteria bacterium RIFCSPLOWO2_01_FULL_39_24]|nr:MAG: hypothetical protein A2800_02445 [Candidatus Levybacteria bacterium RIFCSPHIGHO2_01_FULL_40_16]OGH28088.1 MAG: hypothetical protein A3E12_03510 [Candidatus Levybacteria bacterium RIFCSPHIGHO2_12_FULL_39_9]OGH46618.1 MAG: hypothetical protein A3B47_03155 [Candidatus Levybacteria bacterium RIFCSPLOWO2_01_FULL_39_24]